MSQVAATLVFFLQLSFPQIHSQLNGLIGLGGLCVQGYVAGGVKNVTGCVTTRHQNMVGSRVKVFAMKHKNATPIPVQVRSNRCLSVLQSLLQT